MAGPKNNLEDVLRRRQENGTPSATPASPAPGQTKVGICWKMVVVIF